MSAASEPPPKAVVLLSGGLDSCTAAAMAKAEGFELYALTVAYGQRHAVELEAARRVAAALGVVRHVELQLDLSAFGGSSLVGAGPVPKDRALGEPGIPSTYVPARNTVFLSLALAWAEALGASRHLHRRERARLFRLSGLPAGVHRVVRADWPRSPRRPASRARGSASTRRSCT